MTKADLKDAIEKAVKAERDLCLAKLGLKWFRPSLGAAVKIRLGK